MIIAATGPTDNAVFELFMCMQAIMQKTVSKQVVNKVACCASYTKQVLSQAVRAAVAILQHLLRAQRASQKAECRSSLKIRLQGLEGPAQYTTSVLQSMLS